MMTLSWTVPEIRESLQHVAQALDELLASPHSQDAIKRARLHLHQTHGALQVADLPGVTMLTDEAEQVMMAFEAGTVHPDAQNIATLKQVLRAVVEYLEDMQASGVMVPALVLYPYYRDLVGVRKVLQPDPTVLFDIDLDRSLPAAVRAQLSNAPDREERAQHAARYFERALPALIRGENVVAAVDALHEAMARLLRYQPHAGARLFYWLSYALIDGIKHGALKVDLATRRAVGRINIQNRHLFTGQAEVPAQFIKELLLLLAQAGAGSPAIDEVRRHFHLDVLVPAGYDRPRYGLTDSETLHAAREALTQIHRSWEKIAGGTQGEEQAFADAVTTLNRALAQTPYAGLGMLGRTLATMPQALGSVEGRVREMLAIEVATAVLFMEEALAGALRSNPSYDDRAQELATRISSLLAHPETFDPTPLPWLVALSSQASERMTQSAFVGELKHNLSTCEQALDDYFRDETAVSRLEGVEPLLLETAAVFTLLEFRDAATACRDIIRQVDDVVHARVSLDDARRRRLADGVSSVGFFVETLLQSEGRARRFRFDEARGMLFEDMSLPLVAEETVAEEGVPEGLSLADAADGSRAAADQAAPDTSAADAAAADAALAVAAAGEMGASGETAAADVVAATAPVVRMTGVAEDTAPVTHGTVAAEMTVAGTVAAATVAAGMVAEDVFAATAAMDTAAAAETPAAAESVAGTAPAEPALPEGVLEDGSVELSPDEAELHEIFMMEATEVLDAIAENLVIVRRAPDDREAMTTIRRGFHTLKGSSRMVGLDAFGEAAWAFEQMMNHWLAEDRDGTPALFELIGEGADFFRRWAEQLQVAPRRVLDASLLVARCNAFPDKPAAVEKPAVTEKPVVAEKPAEQADLSALGMDAADPFGSGDLSVDGALNLDDDALPTLDLDNALNLGDGPSGDPTLGDASSVSFDGESPAEFDEISLDSDVPADMPVVAKDDGFSSSHNFARVSHAAGEGDVRQQLEGFLDEASDWKADMLPTDLAELHSDPVRAPEPKTESEEESGDDALFGGPAFDSDVSFDAPQFGNDAAFDDPRFSSDASFDAPPFGSDVAFDGIMSFGGELKLDETVDQGLDAGLSFGSDALSGEPGLSAGWPDAAADGDIENIPLLDLGGDTPAADAPALSQPAVAPETAAAAAEPAAIAPSAVGPTAQAAIDEPAAPAEPSAFGAGLPEDLAAEFAAAGLDPSALDADALDVPTLSMDDALGADSSGAEPVATEAAATGPAHAEFAATQPLVAEAPVAPEPIAAEPAMAPTAAGQADTAAVQTSATPAQPASGAHESQVRIGERLIDAELFEIFNAEAAQSRVRMNEDWSSWQASDALRAPESLVRTLHTLVGTTRHVGLVQVRGIAASLEKLLLKQRETSVELPEAMKASMQAAIGVVDRMLGEFAARIEPAADPETAARMEALLAGWDAEIAAAAQPQKPAAPAEEKPREMRGEDLLKKAAEVLGAARREAQEKRDPLAGLVDEIDPDLGPVFFEEAEELMPQVDNNLREWRERPADGSMPAALMRLFHTIKGSARMAGAMRFGQMIHELETQVEEALAQPPVQPATIEAVLSGYDQAVSAYEVMLHPELAEQRAAEASTLKQQCSAAAGAAHAAMDDGADASATAASPAAAAGAAGEALATGEAVPVCALAAAAAAKAAAARAAVEVAAARTADEHQLAETGTGALPDAVMAGAAANPAAAAQHVIRVRADLLDRMVAEAGEVAIARARLDSEMSLIRSAINELTENVNRLRLQLREIEIQADNQIQAKIAHSNETETEFDPLEFDRYTRFQEVTRMLAESVNDVSTVQQNALRALDAAMQDLARQGQVSRSLQQSLMRVRMVAFSTINDRLYRVVRQAGKDTGKRVTLEIKGGQAEIDRNVLDRMAGPIEHILRNSVAHGVEDAARRATVGKPEVGELTIEVSQDGNEVIMRFLDDGAGLDYPRIEARARERGLIAPEHQPTERELAQMIFAPGFSTAKQVTALAGRGVGMDVVRAEVAGLGGRIDVDSTAGKGSCFTVHLPVSLAVTQVVLLEIEGGKFAVQSALVEQIVQMKPEALTEAYQAGRVEVAGERVPFYFLGSLLEIPGVKPSAQRVAPVVVLRAGATRIALHVDTVVPNQEVVIKHIGPQLARLAGVAGATVLGNGDIVLILNPVQLAMARVAGQLGKVKAATFSASELQTAATVMVVDDSVTVRKVTQRLLVREGYNVLLAKDGVDALRQMQEVIPDVMLVDIEMPRMDGFDLTKNVREHADYANVPIIMITSRTADKHRNHALSLGVDVFLGKPFSEDELLRHVKSFASQRAPRAVMS